MKLTKHNELFEKEILYYYLSIIWFEYRIIEENERKNEKLFYMRESKGHTLALIVVQITNEEGIRKENLKKKDCNGNWRRKSNLKIGVWLSISRRLNGFIFMHTTWLSFPP